MRRLHRGWLRACRRVMETATLWVIGSYHNIHRVVPPSGYWLLDSERIVWIKRNPMLNFAGCAECHETLLWAKKSERQALYLQLSADEGAERGTQMRSDWLIPVCRGRAPYKPMVELHSTQKPEGCCAG